MLEHLTKRTHSKYCRRGKMMRLRCNTLGLEKEITQEGHLTGSDVKSESFDKTKQEMLN